jgi:hypothetical protein
MAEILEQLDLDIEHLDFDHKVGHLWRRGDSKKPHSLSWCGVSKSQHGHDPVLCFGKTISPEEKFCPHCGVILCEKCRSFKLADYERTRSS